MSDWSVLQQLNGYVDPVCEAVCTQCLVDVMQLQQADRRGDQA